MEEIVKKLESEGRRVLMLKTSMELEDVKPGDILTEDVTMQNIDRFFTPKDSEPYLESIQFDYLLLVKGLGVNAKTLLVRLSNCSWSVATHEDGSVVEYEDNGEKFALFLAEFEVESIEKNV